jgi:hypothetical protein
MHVSAHGRCPLAVGAFAARIAVILADEVEVEVVVNTPPTIKLIGKEVVELEHGQPYAKCGPNARRDEKCDRGNAFGGFLEFGFFCVFGRNGILGFLGYVSGFRYAGCFGFPSAFLSLSAHSCRVNWIQVQQPWTRRMGTSTR